MPAEISRDDNDLIAQPQAEWRSVSGVHRRRISWERKAGVRTFESLKWWVVLRSEVCRVVGR